MKLKEIFDAADSLAPFSLSGEYCAKYGMHDNSGIQLDCGEAFERVLFSLDLSRAAVEKAKKERVGLIFTHHPALFYPLSSLSYEGTGREILACARAGISVISAHLNLDCAVDGIDESLANALGGKPTGELMHPLSAGGYGRITECKEMPLATFAEGLKKQFQTERVVVYGDRPVKRVASFCGAGMDGGSVAFAIAKGADTIVTSDGKHHLITEAVEAGLNVVFLTHYAAEDYGFKRFAYALAKKLGMAPKTSIYFTDERFL